MTLTHEDGKASGQLIHELSEAAMTLTHEEVKLLKDRRPGWEPVWAALCADLMAALDNATAGRIGIHWPDDSLREDFVAETIRAYHRKAVGGTLLTGYTCACTDSADRRCGGGVVAYLTGRKFLHDRALKFIGDETKPPPQDPKQRPAPRRGGGEFDHLVKQVQEELAHLTVRMNSGQRIPQDVETAGIELYPQLDWSRLTQLRDWLGTRIPPPPAPWKDCFELLEHLHAAAQKRLEARLDELAARRWNRGRGVSQEKDHELRDMMDQVEVERTFKPLSAEDLMRLLAITKTDAYQRRSRYYRALPELLPRLRELYELLGETLHTEIADQLDEEEEEEDEP